ncbi:4Fe-4S ferredoxin iron-sulfur binding domain-containing protein [Methanobacterium lacus]|jgi:heterodisulfide reductase subunit C1|uniref:4Fe-4S ferredoxin iron-sulfur binding domain-containing protein n=1 Tax=Methanobacterium lacus (strain AL-21) TaxID=877455 RepID=F0T758_METLA|nr:4Fe-4S dicluster domain-containing protein [Methanobacterium lacus]ADZ10692.1 4Fe-4S ferredoxin iron-sulfur binding domain-containing protein [Methanobacterium lacus]
MGNNCKISEKTSVRRITLEGRSGSIKDLRFKKSGFKKCIQCGRCTGSCPSTVIHKDFNPRDMMRRFMFEDLNSDHVNEIIWKCGQCYSCRSRCPRNCKAGLGVVALQHKSYVDGKAPKNIVEIAKKIRNNLYSRGETITPESYNLNLKEEFGEKTAERCSDNHKKREKLGFMPEDAREIPIPEDSLDGVRYILRSTGFKETNHG